MSVRPVEFQLSIPKAFEASREQQNTLRRPDMEAMQKNIKLEEEMARQRTSVKDLEKTDKRELQNDLEGESAGSYQGREREKEEKEEEKPLCFTPGKLDIKI